MRGQPCFEDRSSATHMHLALLCHVEPVGEGTCAIYLVSSGDGKEGTKARGKLWITPNRDSRHRQSRQLQSKQEIDGCSCSMHRSSPLRGACLDFPPPINKSPLLLMSPQLFLQASHHSHILSPLFFLVAFLVTVNIKHPSSHSWVIAANRALPIFFTRKIAFTTAPPPDGQPVQGWLQRPVPVTQDPGANL